MCCSFGGDEGFDGGDYSYAKGVVVRNIEEIRGHKGWGFRRIVRYGTRDDGSGAEGTGKVVCVYGYEGSIHVIKCYVI